MTYFQDSQVCCMLIVLMFAVACTDEDATRRRRLMKVQIEGLRNEI